MHYSVQNVTKHPIDADTNKCDWFPLYTFLTTGCTIMEQLAHNSYHKGLQTSKKLWLTLCSALSLIQTVIPC